MELDRRTLIIAILAVLTIGGLAYIALGPQLVLGAVTGATSEAEDSTPFGESLEISLGSSSSTSQTASYLTRSQLAAWLASYSDTDSQDVYSVNSTYKSQEQVTLEYSLSVTYNQVSSIQATVQIKAIDDADSSEHIYTLANSKSLSGGSPISDSGSTAPSISAHLSDIVASSTDATIRYQIYCQVTGTGDVSGESLTATVPYTNFGCLHYEQTSESSEANVTPSVSVASMVDDALGLPPGSSMAICAVMAWLAAVIVWRRQS